MNTLEKSFAKLINEAKKNANVLASFLVGSRGKGFNKSESDFDCYFITKNGRSEKVVKELKTYIVPGVDASIYSEKDFKNYAEFGSSEAWDRYDFVHVKMLFDKTGRMSKTIVAKGEVPASKRREYIAGQLDGYVNGVFRSLKATSKKNYLGARLEAAGALQFLMNALFALEGRSAPFLGYLENELKQHPLKQLPLRALVLISLISKILTTSDKKRQILLGKKVEKVFRKNGFGKVFDAWGDKLPW